MSRATTQTQRKKKAHTKFRQVTEYDSSPLALITEAEATKTTVKDLRRNPEKYSFGKVPFKNGIWEGYIYARNVQKLPNSVIVASQKRNFEKEAQYICDERRLKEILSLITKMLYFLRLTKKRKQEYLRNKDHFANINIRKDM